MWRGARIAVVVPAYSEERLIGRTLGAMPAWVDHIVVVDDASPDATAEVASSRGDERILIERHAENRGVGAAIATGYARALALGADVMIVMAGDAQMDPVDLEAVVAPVVAGEADYVKGNRFRHRDAGQMPWARRLGGRALSALTRACFDLEVDDTQCGYTALSARAARAIDLADLWPRYGYPNDLLGLLAAEGLCIREVPVRPVYADESSGVRPWHVLLIAGVILRRRAAIRSARASQRSDRPGPRSTPATSPTPAARAR
jgi:dolichol-phosphate mannosyltransferase